MSLSLLIVSAAATLVSVCGLVLAFTAQRQLWQKGPLPRLRTLSALSAVCHGLLLAYGLFGMASNVVALLPQMGVGLVLYTLFIGYVPGLLVNGCMLVLGVLLAGAAGAPRRLKALPALNIAVVVLRGLGAFLTLGAVFSVLMMRQPDAGGLLRYTLVSNLVSLAVNAAGIVLAAIGCGMAAKGLKRLGFSA